MSLTRLGGCIHRDHVMKQCGVPVTMHHGHIHVICVWWLCLAVVVLFLACVFRQSSCAARAVAHIVLCQVACDLAVLLLSEPPVD